MPPFLLRYTGGKEWKRLLVSMPSRADISFLRDEADSISFPEALCQCPLGLELLLFEWMRQYVYLIVSMPSRAYTSFLQVLLLSS